MTFKHFVFYGIFALLFFGCAHNPNFARNHIQDREVRAEKIKKESRRSFQKFKENVGSFTDSLGSALAREDTARMLNKVYTDYSVNNQKNWRSTIDAASKDYARKNRSHSGSQSYTAYQDNNQKKNDTKKTKKSKKKITCYQVNTRVTLKEYGRDLQNKLTTHIYQPISRSNPTGSKNTTAVAYAKLTLYQNGEIWHEEYIQIISAKVDAPRGCVKFGWQNSIKEAYQRRINNQQDRKLIYTLPAEHYK